jgi:hypothetical protein
MSWLRGAWLFSSPNQTAFIVSSSPKGCRYGNSSLITKVRAWQLFDSRSGRRADDNGTCRKAFCRERHVCSIQENVRSEAGPCSLI